VKNGSICGHTKTKMITHKPILYKYHWIHFTSENASFLWYLSVCQSVCLSVTYLTYLSFTHYWNAV